jgi:hypothetical protein
MMSLQNMNNQILEDLKGLTKRTPGFAGGPCDLKLIAIDYRFKYNLHSHFTFHIDQRLGRELDITVVVKVTADKTTMQVAGAEKEASSTGIGGAHAANLRKIVKFLQQLPLRTRCSAGFGGVRAARSLSRRAGADDRGRAGIVGALVSSAPHDSGAA